MGSVNISGLIAMIVFYVLILVIGLLAAWFKTRKGRRRTHDLSTTATVMVADRDIGLCVGIFTMTATWVGGGYINGTAEQVFISGILWAQAPLGFSFSLIIGGLFFAGPMREKAYLTLLDPFQNKYGKAIGGLMFIPALCGDLFWSAAILNALGSAVSVILGVEFIISVIASACVAVAYTFFGGLYSVAYTDVVQLACIVLGLIPCIPYSLSNEHVNVTLDRNLSSTYTINNSTIIAADIWGTIPTSKLAAYIDDYLLVILGGIPWQVYFQRVLSAKSARNAQILSCFAGLGCILCAILAGAIGYVARFADWDAVGYPEVYSNPQVVLPSVIQYLTTPVVSFIGLGAVSAAVMSSSDSSMLSISSMFSHNVYRNIFRRKASDREIVWVLRGCIVLSGALACTIGICVRSIYSLFVLCSDLVYVLLFPQFFFVIYVSWINRCSIYGVVAGFFSSFLFRILLGEPLFMIPAVIEFNTFPNKTAGMLINLVVTPAVSLLIHFLFVSGNKLHLKWDHFNAFDHLHHHPRHVNVDKEHEMTVSHISKEFTKM